MKKKRIYGDPRLHYVDMFPEMQTELLNREITEIDYLHYEPETPILKSIVKLKLVGIGNEHYIFDGNYKDYVYVDRKPSENKYLKNVQINDEVDVLISSINNNVFFIEGSISAIYETQARNKLTSLAEGEFVNVKIVSLSPAGYNVEILLENITLTGFLPNILADVNKLPDPSVLLGKEIQVMIESYSNEDGNYIVNRKKYLNTLIADKIANLNTDMLYSGVVTGTLPYGIFVQFEECLTGMLHVSSLKPEIANNIATIVPGTPIEFNIREITKDKIILCQVYKETLWDTLKVGDEIVGKAKDYKSIGLLVELDEETNGLIPKNELDKATRKPSINEEVILSITSVDRYRRKIYLNFR